MASPAERYLATFSPEDQELIRSSSGGDLTAWYQNAVNAGAVPQEFQTPQGGTGGQGGGGGQAGTPNWNHVNADLMQKEYERLVAAGYAPDAAERAARFGLGGVAHDYAANYAWNEGGGAIEGASAEQSANQYAAWDKYYDPACPPDFPYRSEHGWGKGGVPGKGASDKSNCAEKPADSWQDSSGGVWHGNWAAGQGRPGAGGWGNEDSSYFKSSADLDAAKAAIGAGGAPGEGGGEGGGPGGKGGQNQPPQPTTFGNNLSMTGNVMQDMLIQQFNTGQQTTYSQGANIFGLGEDFRPGGEGANADKRANIQGQSLAGGGIWWGQGNETFKGQDQKDVFRADQKNAEPPPAAPAAAPAQPASQVSQGGSNNNQNNQNQGVSDMLNNQTFAAEGEPPQTTPVTQMIGNQYSRRKNERPTGYNQQPRFF